MHNHQINLPSYPVLKLRPAIQKALSAQKIPAISAPPGSGKSTLVPFFLLDAPWRQSRTILLLQPRRPAVRALAARLKELAAGQARIGYITRYEQSVPRKPDIIVMTEGIFIRQLLDDPELSNTATVILDEFHERSLATDTAYVLARQCRELFRPDLRLIIMSATLDKAQFSAAPFSILHAEGTLHPVNVEHHAPPARTPIEQHGAELCRQWTTQNNGNILFFLPGEAEIRRVVEAFSAGTLPKDVDVFPLYGRLSPEEQSRAIAPPAPERRKIVIATNIAETSLTIEGITCVIDSGLRRRSRWDPDTGLSRLETTRISQASAEQRAGRAGRLGPGTVLRLWEQYEKLEDFDSPEIQKADLSGLFLTLAAWGDTQTETFHWPNPPDPERRQQALQLLDELGAIDKNGVPTDKGVAMARMPVAPRLASMLIKAAETHYNVNHTGSLAAACMTAAVLEHGDPFKPDFRKVYGADLDLRVELLLQARSGHLPYELSRRLAQRILGEAERLKGIARASSHRKAKAAAGPQNSSHSTAGSLLIEAYPDRFGRLTETGNNTGAGIYRLAGGIEARMQPGERGFQPQWIVAGAVHRGARRGTIFLSAALSEKEVQRFIGLHGSEKEELSIDNSGILKARRFRKVESLQVSSTPISLSELASAHTSIINLIRESGLQVLPWNRAAEELRSRIAFLHQVQGGPWPDVSDTALLASLEEWLAPFLPRTLTQNSLRQLPLTEALRSLLPWELQSEIDTLAPSHIKLPSGTRQRLKYEKGRCVLSARIQQLFGLTDTPQVGGKSAGVPVEIELLSPAQRPVQVTRDLNSFWKDTYPEVRKELRGRYPKHYWPQDPLTATPTDRSKPRGS